MIRASGESFAQAEIASRAEEIDVSNEFRTNSRCARVRSGCRASWRRTLRQSPVSRCFSCRPFVPGARPGVSPQSGKGISKWLSTVV